MKIIYLCLDCIENGQPKELTIEEAVGHILIGHAVALKRDKEEK